MLVPGIVMTAVGAVVLAAGLLDLRHPHWTDRFGITSGPMAAGSPNRGQADGFAIGTGISFLFVGITLALLSLVA